jgi:actin related protein 2/3 complex subunit 2
MILLEDTNTLIQTLLLERIGQEKATNVDQLFVDFDGVAYHLSTPEEGNRSVVLLSMCMRPQCWKELVSYGALDNLRKEYGEYLQPQSEGNTLRSDGTSYSWDVSLKFDMGPEGLGSQSVDEQRDFVRRAAMLKR